MILRTSDYTKHKLVVNVLEPYTLTDTTIVEIVVTTDEGHAQGVRLTQRDLRALVRYLGDIS